MELLCIKSHSEGLVLSGYLYKVYEEVNCPNCGFLSYDVHAKPKSGYIGGAICICGKSIRPDMKFSLVGSTLFGSIATEYEVENKEQQLQHV